MEYNYENTKYEYLFTKYKNYVYQSVYGILKNGEDAEDVVQETYIVSYKRRMSLRDTQKFKFWIRRIAVNLAIDKYRKKKREILMEEGKIFYLKDQLLPVDTTVKTVEEKEQHRYLMEKIYDLKEEYREVIELYYFNELSYREIGERLDINLAAVKSRLYRAKGKLRQHIM